jgi:small subunit ribosomal protein S2
MMSREREKLEYSLGGIKEMHAAPQMLFVIDIKREEIAVKEARRLDIPVVALVDTNCDPKAVNYPIPSNDDGTRAIRLFCQAVADTILDGKQVAVERRVAESLESRRGRQEAGRQEAKGGESPKDGAEEATAADSAAPASSGDGTPESETPL